MAHTAEPHREPKRKKPKLIVIPGGAPDGTPDGAPLRPAPDKSLAFLSRLATEFSAVLSLSDLLEHVMRILRDETGFASCSLALVDSHNPEFLVLRAASGIRESFLGLAIPRDKGLHGVVMQAGEPLIVPDMHADPRVFRRDARIRSGIYAPLSVGRRRIGVLSAHREQLGGFTQIDLDLLTVVARYLTGAIEVARLHEQLKEIAATDALTGLANRRSFLGRLVAEISRARRKESFLSVVLIDLDGFKDINDTFGHAKGDEALIRVAESLTRGIRASDLAARIGGDEFVLLLPEATEGQAGEILGRFCGLKVPVPQQESSPTLTFSWGIAAFPEDGGDPDQLLQVADSRLYVMKKRLHEAGGSRLGS
ncbi:MAG: sensor domain-containing diguanylate cyclase [Bacillati bacterium ANGP1]|uniref:Sensor domain-containing diguanylate cyclase n=1 Tax=Candidatus Segetimicrobium genomatis TaxID=2569760 RepID=A0A537M1U2_9BACT|nr:MAG: sensor domain-containing diguanylate cyclase [Terrabacteria group bacterium ANGP1]TMJ14251.1 MAG: sensor domain-containing diguanylate cyclase [Terrabacteria group bacterium ANGP1]